MYRLEIFERLNSDGVGHIIFSKNIPIPKASVYVYTEDTMCSYIRSLDLPWYVKDAYIAQIHYTLHQWFSKNFFRFIEVDYKTSNHTFNIMEDNNG